MPVLHLPSGSVNCQFVLPCSGAVVELHAHISYPGPWYCSYRAVAKP